MEISEENKYLAWHGIFRRAVGSPPTVWDGSTRRYFVWSKRHPLLSAYGLDGTLCGMLALGIFISGRRFSECSDLSHTSTPRGCNVGAYAHPHIFSQGYALGIGLASSGLAYLFPGRVGIIFSEKVGVVLASALSCPHGTLLSGQAWHKYFPLPWHGIFREGWHEYFREALAQYFPERENRGEVGATHTV